MGYTFMLPFPVSVNKIYERTYRGGVRLSDAAVAFKQEAIIEAYNQGIDTPLQGRLGILIHVYPKTRRGDIDNLLKLTLDSLNKIAWNDDSQIDEIHIVRKPTTQHPCIEITVWELLPEINIKKGTKNGRSRRR